MDKNKLINEIRYAERLCQRSSRLYRHFQSAQVFMTVMGGSAIFASAVSIVPAWLSVTGGVAFAAFGSLGLAIKPAEKVAAIDNDQKRYAQLRSSAASMSYGELEVALNKIRETDTPEIESLRDVAYNDVVTEMGQYSYLIELTRHQKILRSQA
jgi:hypothetical protein